MVMDGGPSITSHSQLQMTSYSEFVKQLPRMDCLADLSASPGKGVKGCQLKSNWCGSKVRELENVSPGGQALPCHR